MDQDLMRALMANGSFFQALLDRGDEPAAALPDMRDVVRAAQQDFVEDYALQHRILFAERFEPVAGVFFDGPEPPRETAHLGVWTFEGKAVDREAAVRTMDEEIRKDISARRPIRDEEFFREYARRHAREHCEAWEPVPGRRILPVYQVAIRFDGDEKAGGERIWWESAVSPRAAAEAVAAEITPADFFHDGSAAANPSQRFDLVVSADAGIVGDRPTGPVRGVFEYEWGGFHSPPSPVRDPRERMAALARADAESRRLVEIQRELDQREANRAGPEQAPDAHCEAAHEDAVNGGIDAGYDCPQWDEQFEQCTTHGEAMER